MQSTEGSAPDRASREGRRTRLWPPDGAKAALSEWSNSAIQLLERKTTSQPKDLGGSWSASQIQQPSWGTAKSNVLNSLWELLEGQILRAYMLPKANVHCNL